MKQNKVKEQEYRSMKEYEKKYYPETYKADRLKTHDPNTLGITLAKESLNKFKSMMQKQRVSVSHLMLFRA